MSNFKEQFEQTIVDGILRCKTCGKGFMPQNQWYHCPHNYYPSTKISEGQLKSHLYTGEKIIFYAY